MNKTSAIFLPSLKLGGGNRVLLQLFDFLSRNKKTSKLYFIERDGKSFKNSTTNARIYKPLINNIFFYLIAVIYASYQIRKDTNLNYVILSDPILAIFSFIYSNKKIIRYVQSDDASLFKYNPNAGLLLKFFYVKFFLISQKYSYHKIFFNSKFSMNAYQKTFKPLVFNNFKIINPGIFTLNYPKKRINYPTKKNIIVAIVLSHHMRKGSKSFFNIVKKSTFKQIQYLVITQDDFDFSHPNVLFCKPDNDNEYVALLKKCHFILSTSTFEGFGLPLLEAMALGLVPIAFMNGGIKEYTRYIDVDIISGVKSFDKVIDSFIIHNSGFKKYKLLSKQSYSVASIFNEQNFYLQFTNNL